MSVVPRLVVAGGNGFLGSRICKAAVARGWDVVSLSRSGEPHWPNNSPPEWARKVTWDRADLLQPSSYAGKLSGATAVVHSMGILLEADYKGVLQGKEPVVEGLKKAFSSAASRGPGLTYEMVQRDSALDLAREAVKGKVKTLAYISAADGFPIVPARYISTKRDAEKGIGEMSELRGIFMRPGFMYYSSRSFTMPIALGTGIVASINGLFGNKLPLGAAGYKPLRVDRVAEATVEAIMDENIKGVVEVERIDELATKVWREQKML